VLGAKSRSLRCARDDKKAVVMTSKIKAASKGGFCARRLVFESYFGVDLLAAGVAAGLAGRVIAAEGLLVALGAFTGAGTFDCAL
jgi:hypothetical protein